MKNVWNKTKMVISVEIGLLVGWFLCYINLCRLFNAKSIFMQIVLFKTIQFNIDI